MKFELSINMDNEAFTDDPNGELAYILESVVMSLKLGSTGGNVRDINGNRTGKWSIAE